MPLPEPNLGNAETLATLADLYRRPGYLIRRAHQRSNALFAEHCPEVTGQQYGALQILSVCERLNQKQLAALLFVDRTSMGIIVRGLEKRGLITRIPDPDDQRNRLLEITESGLQSLGDLTARALAMQEAFLAPLDQKERELLIALLIKLNGDHGSGTVSGL